MNILALDNEITALNILKRAIEEATKDCEIRTFQRASLALKEVSEKMYVPDVAFLDIEMPNMTGIEFAIKLKKLCPDTNIIFVTGFSEYAYEAYRIKSSGYLLKPVTTEMVKEELDNLKKTFVIETTKKLKVCTFGNFEVYFNNKPVDFIEDKAKEIFAYLIDKEGKGTSYDEISRILWDDVYDKERQKELSVYMGDLIKSLDEVGESSIIIKNKKEVMVDVSKIDCDMYRFFNGEIAAINSYHGEYMNSYSWAEITSGRLTKNI